MAWRIPIVDLAAEFLEAGPAVEAAVLRVLRSQQFILGPETAAFEAELAARIGVEFAVGVSSGTDALVLALRAAGVGPGDEVVTSAFTYFASVEAILLAGARPVFADIETDGFGVDPARVEAALGPRTRAILPIHLFGRCADLPRLQALADARGHRARRGRRPGDRRVAGGPAGRRLGPRRLLQLLPLEESRRASATAAASPPTTRRSPNASGSTAATAARGTARTRCSAPPPGSTRCRRRRCARSSRSSRAGRRLRARNARIYAEALAGCEEIEIPERRGGRDAGLEPVHDPLSRCAPVVRAALEAEGIEWRHYYPMPAPSQPALGAARCAPGSFPEAERACAEVLSIPVRPSCSPDDDRAHRRRDPPGGDALSRSRAREPSASGGSTGSRRRRPRTPSSRPGR